MRKQFLHYIVDNYKKRYALLAQMKPEKFLYVAQGSVMASRFSVGFYYIIRATRFSQDLIWKSGVQCHASSLLIVSL